MRDEARLGDGGPRFEVRSVDSIRSPHSLVTPSFARTNLGARELTLFDVIKKALL